jgi:hypothetical protein
MKSAIGRNKLVLLVALAAVSCALNELAAARPFPVFVQLQTQTPTATPTGPAFFVKNAGSDSANGTSDATAWATIAKVNSFAQSPGFGVGTHVYFKNGDTWRERMQPKGSDVTYTAYGGGSKPVISGADVLTGWTSLGSGLYSKVLAAGTVVMNVYVDDSSGAAAGNQENSDPKWGLVRALGLPSSTCTNSNLLSGASYSGGPKVNTIDVFTPTKGSAAIAKMNNGSWLFYKTTGSTAVPPACAGSPTRGTLYIQLGDGSDPATRTIEATVRSAAVYAIDTQVSRNTFDNLHLTKASNGVNIQEYSSGVTANANSVFQNLQVDYTGNGQVDDDAYWNGLDVEVATAPTYYNNVISYTGGHGNSINTQETDGAVVDSNVADHCNHHLFDTKDSINVTVKNNVGHDCVAAPCCLLAPFQNTSEDLGAHTTGMNGIYFECPAQPTKCGPGHSANYTARNNIIYGLDTYAIGGEGDGVQMDPSVGGGITIYNNSVRKVRIGLYDQPANASGETAKNNAIDQTTAAAMQISNVVEDYNANGRLAAGGEALVTDGNSNPITPGAHDVRNTDPKWVDPSSGNFTLQSTSLLINAGINVGLPFLGSAPDIGALELQ